VTIAREESVNQATRQHLARTNDAAAVTSTRLGALNIVKRDYECS
jgi:hypothetical protein